MPEIDDDFEILVNRFFRSRFSCAEVPHDIWTPPTDIYETGRGAVLKMELAGVDPGNIQIFLEGKKLIVQGVRHDPSESEKVSYHQMEIIYGPFRSVFSLPFIVKAKEVKARYNNGFLEIHLPYSSDLVDELIQIDIK